MAEGNKVNINDIGEYEFVISKCGLLSLVCIAKPTLNLFRYEIKSDKQSLMICFNISQAISAYNNLVI